MLPELLRLTVGLTLLAGGLVLADDRPAADKVDVHLVAWEKATKGTTNVRAEFTLTRKDAVFPKERVYTGAVLHLRPRFIVLRMDNAADSKDYEAYVCDGKTLYEYSGLNQTITEVPLPELPPPAEPARGAGSETLLERFKRLMAQALTNVADPEHNFPLMVLSGVNSEALKKRFRVSVFKEDEHYVYLELKPQNQTDRQMFETVRIALLRPDAKTPQGVPDGTVPAAPYTPALIWILLPNGDAELWKFTNVRRNLSEIDEKAFQFRPVPGFTHKKPPSPQPEAARP